MKKGILIISLILLMGSIIFDESVIVKGKVTGDTGFGFAGRKYYFGC